MAWLLAGCASFGLGLGSLSENHGVAKPVVVSAGADDWWIYDRPLEGKMLVQRASASPVQGISSGLGASPKPNYQAAAESYLASDGRRCTIKNGYVVVEPSWEFAYQCEEPTSSIAPKKS